MLSSSSTSTSCSANTLGCRCGVKANEGMSVASSHHDTNAAADNQERKRKDLDHHLLEEEDVDPAHPTGCYSLGYCP